MVSGHSNTVPHIVEALGAGPVPSIDDSEYDNLYVVTTCGCGDGATVLRLNFGVPDVELPEP